LIGTRPRDSLVPNLLPASEDPWPLRTTLTPDKLQAATVALMGAERRLRARDQQGRHLTSSQLRALFALDGKQAVPAGQLARAADLNPGTVTAMLDSLERDGIIERHPDADDRRVTLVSLTEIGQDLMGERRERWFALWHEHLGDLSPEELDFAVDVIRRVTRVIDNL
jgi:DNA-binding MarR family transcriptional regulator